MKRWIKVLGVLLAVLVIVIVAVLMSFGRIVKTGIQTVGPAVAGVVVNVREADVSVLSGSGSLRGLVVGNPEGYTSPSAMTAGEIRLELDPKTFLSDKLHVRLIRLQAPEITFEGVPSENNLIRILASVRDFTHRTKDAPVAGAEPPPRGRKMQVDEFLIADAMLHVQTSFTGPKPVSLHVEDLRLIGLGQGPDGITGPELAQRVLTELLGSTTNLVDEAFLKIGEDLKGALPPAINTLPDAGGALLKELPRLPSAGTGAP